MRFMDVTAVSTLGDSSLRTKTEQHPDPPYNAANDPFHSDWPHW